MTYATEFLPVQSALGFSDKSVVSSKPFADYDEQYKASGRLVDKSATLQSGMIVRGIFVDDALVLCIANGTVVQTNEENLRKTLGI